MNTPIVDAMVGVPPAKIGELPELTVSRQLAYLRMVARQLERDRARLIEAVKRLCWECGFDEDAFIGDLGLEAK